MRLVNATYLCDMMMCWQLGAVGKLYGAELEERAGGRCPTFHWALYTVPSAQTSLQGFLKHLLPRPLIEKLFSIYCSFAPSIHS